MATDASMDPTTPPHREALGILRAQIRQIHRMLSDRARESGEDFYYRSKDASPPLEVLVTCEDMHIRFFGQSVSAGQPSLDAQRLLALADELPSLCVQATAFYDRLGRLRESDYRPMFDRVLAKLTRAEAADPRGANMPDR